jgi:P4 family phage/plasmid primase-like protien
MTSLPHNDMTIEEQQEKELKTGIIVRNQKDPIQMAMFLVEEYPNLIRCQENIYKYNGKCYDLLSDKDLDEMFLTFCINYGVTSAWKNIGSVVRAFLVYPKIRKVEKMNDYPQLLNLNNGILNIHTKEFIKHDPSYNFDSFVAIDYNAEDKSCPVFLKYLTNTFNGQKDTITNIIRLGGYLLDTSCAAEKMFLFDGGGSNGKSVLINTFQMFFSEDQITPLSLDKLASDSFSKELLIKSRVNFCAEQKKGFLDSEELKKIITCDKMEINRKFKVSLSFTPKCKIISASNGKPTFKDNSYAIYRRILIVNFPNKYVSDIEYAKIKNPTSCHVFLKDKTLLDKIKLELSAILNLFIEGLLDLRANNYEFIESEDSVVAMNEYKRDSDTVREFLEDNYEIDEDAKTPLREIYDYYKSWYHYNVQENGVIKFRINEMGKRIKDIMGIDAVSRGSVFNSTTQRLERETMYPIKLVEPIVQTEEILTEEQAEQLGINFNDK